MVEVYEQCPVLEDDKYLLRLVDLEDANDLLKVYSDEKAFPYFNSDNCNDNFHYKTIERMQEAIKFWIYAYEVKAFVRWSIIDKDSREAIGTIELFNRPSNDSFNGCGLLRLDLSSDYENQDCIKEILSIIMSSTYDLFHCNMIVTKAVPSASERIHALKHMGFEQSEDKLVGPDGTEFDHYLVCFKNSKES